MLTHLLRNFRFHGVVIAVLHFCTKDFTDDLFPFSAIASVCAAYLIAGCASKMTWHHAFHITLGGVYEWEKIILVTGWLAIGGEREMCAKLWQISRSGRRPCVKIDTYWDDN